VHDPVGEVTRISGCRIPPVGRLGSGWTLSLVNEDAPGKQLVPRVRLSRTPRKGRGLQMNTAVAPSTPLSAVDRCDRCGAQAYLRVELAGGGDLLFCAHHAREHGDKLREIAVAVQDETDKLADSPSGAGD
jgi:hypothetical protein